MADDILEEVWRNRDEFARRHNHDLGAMVAALREMERHPWTAIISREKETPNRRLSGASPLRRG